MQQAKSEHYSIGARCNRCQKDDWYTTRYPDAIILMCSCVNVIRVEKDDRFIRLFNCPECGDNLSHIVEKDNVVYIRCNSCGHEHEIPISDDCQHITPPSLQNNAVARVPKCPTCGSVQVKKISTTAKVASGAMFGLFSKTARSQFQCLNCNYKW